MVVVVHDEDVARAIDGGGIWKLELTISRAVRAPLGEKRPAAAQFLDAMVESIGHIDIPGGISGEANGMPELPVAGTPPANRRAVDSNTAELLQAIVVGVGDVDVAVAIGRDPRWVVELTVLIAGRAPRGHDLIDFPRGASSITAANLVATTCAARLAATIRAAGLATAFRLALRFLLLGADVVLAQRCHRRNDQRADTPARKRSAQAGGLSIEWAVVHLVLRLSPVTPFAAAPRRVGGPG